MRLKPVSLFASMGVGVFLVGSARASEPFPTDCNDPCAVVTCAPAPCVRVLPSLCDVFKRRVFEPICIERPPLLSRLHRNNTCVPQSLGNIQSMPLASSQSTPTANPQSAPSNPAPSQAVAQAAAPSMVTVPVQSFVMVPVTTWQSVPVTSYQTVSSNSLQAQAFHGIQTAGGQSVSSNALVELEARLTQALRAGGSASAQAAGATPCAKTQAELDKRFLELEKRLTDLQLDASKVLVKHDGELGEIKATLKLLLIAGADQKARGEDQKARIEKLEKEKPKAAVVTPSADVPMSIPLPMPMPMPKPPASK